MEDWDWTMIGVLVALALGVLGVWLGDIAPRLRERARGRRATLDVRREHFWRNDVNRMADRIVILNHGPHPARQVELVAMSDVNGGHLNPAGCALNPVVPVSVLQPLQEHHTIIELAMDQMSPVEAVVRWSDGDGEHVETFALSPQYV